MFNTLQKVSGMAFVLTLVLGGGTAFAGSDLVLYGTTGNCAAGQVCTVLPVTFGGLGGDGASNGFTSAAPTSSESQHGHHGHQGQGQHQGGGPGHGNGGGMGGNGGGMGGHGGGGGPMHGGGGGGGGDGEK